MTFSKVVSCILELSLSKTSGHWRRMVPTVLAANEPHQYPWIFLVTTAYFLTDVHSLFHPQSVVGLVLAVPTLPSQGLFRNLRDWPPGYPRNLNSLLNVLDGRHLSSQRIIINSGLNGCHREPSMNDRRADADHIRQCTPEGQMQRDWGQHFRAKGAYAVNNE